MIMKISKKNKWIIRPIAAREPPARMRRFLLGRERTTPRLMLKHLESISPQRQPPDTIWHREETPDTSGINSISQCRYREALWSSGKTLAANAGGRGFDSHRGQNSFFTIYSIREVECEKLFCKTNLTLKSIKIKNKQTLTYVLIASFQ